MNIVQSASVSVWNCSMVSTIQHGMEYILPLRAAVDTTAQLGCGSGRVCPVIPPAGIVGCASLTLPDRRGVEDRES